jgi:tripartite ATP-independent transporter DctM subunit
VRNNVGRYFHYFEAGVSNLSLILIALLLFAGAFLRLVFHTAIPGSDSVTVHLLLVSALFSAMITTKESGHLSISIVQYIKNKKISAALGAVTGLLSAFIATILCFCSAVFIRIALNPPTRIGFLSDRVFALSLVIAFAVMAYRFVRLAPLTGKARILSLAAIVFGIVCSLPLIAKFIWQFNLPGWAYTVNDFFYYLASVAKAPIVIFLILAALAGTPLFIIIAGISIILIQSSGGEIDVGVNQIYTALTQQNIIAIPLFTLTGFFLSESRAGERLVKTFRAFFCAIPGGMITATVLICAFFTSFTGASGVTILALGGILYTVLSGGKNQPDNAKYPDQFTVGLLTSCGSIGLLFPPSLPLILVGTTTQTSIKQLFVAGIIPGLILAFSMIILGVVISRKTKMPVEKFNIKRAVISLKGSFFEILLPIFLITGYFTGILTLVEIGAAALIYTFIVEVIIFREIKPRDIPKVFSKSLPITGGILIILALSQALSYYIIDTQAPENFARWAQQAITSKLVFLLILNLMLLVVGCLVDIFSAILIFLPLLVPLADAFGINHIHLGMIFLVNLEAGFLTPPVGLNLFLAHYRFKQPFVEICRSVLPFLAIQLLVVILITYIPQISTVCSRFF